MQTIVVSLAQPQISGMQPLECALHALQIHGMSNLLKLALHAHQDSLLILTDSVFAHQIHHT